MDIQKTSGDDLDWAASLPHATVAAMHLSTVVALVREGWLATDPAHTSEVTAAVCAMEAFALRTMVAVAGVLDVMDDDARAEFFSDFAEDFPPQLSIEEES